MSEESGSLVSVILATNRATRFLDEALASVAAQTLQDFELLAVDNGTPDHDAFAGQVRRHVPAAVVLREQEGGVAAARNLAAAQASGRYLAFIDDDDRWDPRRLEEQAASLSADPAAPLGYCRMRSIGPDGETIAPADQVPVRDELEVARRVTGIICPNIMVPREAFERIGGFRRELRRASDYDLVVRLAALGTFAFTPAVLVDYRAHAANMTANYRQQWAAIEAIGRHHREAARRDGRRELESAHAQSLAANARYAWWNALGESRAQLRAHHVVAAAAAVVWAARVAPGGPLSAIGRRLRPAAHR